VQERHARRYGRTEADEGRHAGAPGQGQGRNDRRSVYRVEGDRRWLRDRECQVAGSRAGDRRAVHGAASRPLARGRARVRDSSARGHGMIFGSSSVRLRSILIATTAGIVAVPAAVLGVDAVARWSPRPSAIAARVAAAKDLDAYLEASEDSVAGVKPAARKGIRWQDAAHTM